MIKLLKVKQKPYITSRASTALQLSAIQSLPQYNEAWLCNEFINLRYLAEDKVRCDFLHKDFWFINAKMFIRQSLLFSKETLGFKSFNVLEYITSAIDAGKYVTGDFNAFYIPNKLEYQTINKRDTYLIYGYDMHNKSFYLLGDTVNGYTSYEVAFDDYINSISNRDDGMFNINIMEYNPDFLFEFSMERLKSNLFYYINSLDTNIFYNVTSSIYGIEAIKKLKSDIISDYGLGRIWADKSFIVLYEHKYLMLQRIRYLKDFTDINVDTLIDQFENVFHIANTIVQQCNEFRDSKRIDSYPIIIELLDELISKDSTACGVLLDLL